MSEKHARITVYPSELLIPFLKEKIEVGKQYDDPVKFRVAFDTADRFIDIVRGLVEKAKTSEEEDNA